jgi:hypothetical protein
MWLNSWYFDLIFPKFVSGFGSNWQFGFGTAI